MTNKTDGGSVAVNLMRMALGLLDRDGETLAAARLQHAIDTANGAQPARCEADVPPELIAAILDRPPR